MRVVRMRRCRDYNRRAVYLSIIPILSIARQRLGRLKQFPPHITRRDRARSFSKSVSRNWFATVSALTASRASRPQAAMGLILPRPQAAANNALAFASSHRSLGDQEPLT